MASKRMISKMIVDSDAFLDMPQTTQNLYFHLNLRADDDGFIDNPKKIMRTIGSNQNDLEILLAKRYLLAFDSGVIVIKHWKMHNTIQKDRYRPTVYQEELEQLIIKKSGAYTDHKTIQDKDIAPRIQNGSRMDPECIQNGHVDQVRLDIDQINNTDEPESTLPALTPTAEPKGSLSQMKDPLADYYQNLFIGIQPASTWGDFNKERSQLNTLAKKSKALFSDGVPYNDEYELATTLFTTFLEMRKHGHFKAKDTPVIPSVVSNLWPDIIAKMIKEHSANQPIEIGADDDILF